jgi:hypothetical protein
MPATSCGARQLVVYPEGAALGMFSSAAQASTLEGNWHLFPRSEKRGKRGKDG